jgi:hypothetical protein
MSGQPVRSGAPSGVQAGAQAYAAHGLAGECA